MTVAMEATSTNGYALPILYVCVWRFVFQMSSGSCPRRREKAIESTYGLMQSNADNMRTVPKVAPIDKGGEGGGGSENIHALIFGWGAQMVMSKDLEKAYKMNLKY